MPYVYKEPEPIRVRQHSDGPSFLAYPIKDLQEIMAHRCEEQGHDYQNCCSATFRLYQECRWCGQQKPL